MHLIRLRELFAMLIGFEKEKSNHFYWHQLIENAVKCQHSYISESKCFRQSEPFFSFKLNKRGAFQLARVNGRICCLD